MNYNFENIKYNFSSEDHEKVTFELYSNTTEFGIKRIMITRESEKLFDNLKIDFCKLIGYDVQFAKINFSLTNKNITGVRLTSKTQCCKLLVHLIFKFFFKR